MARRKSRRTPGGLPQFAETWCVAARQLRAWIAPPDEEPVRPWLTLILNLDRGTIQNSELSEEQPDAEMVMACVLAAIQKPPRELGQKPHRPEAILLEAEEKGLIDTVTQELTALQITVEANDHLLVIDDVVAELEDHLRGGEELPGLLSVEGVTPALAGDVFAAAAEFYQAAPWVHLIDQQTFAVQVAPETTPRFVQVMGGGGVEYGLAMYRRWEDVERLFSFADNPFEILPPDGGNTFAFDELTALPFDDAEAMEMYGWPIADEMAYPVPLIFTREGEAERPGVADLHWYSATLRALPIFVEEHLQQADDPSVEQPLEATLTIPTHAGDSEVKITYPAGDLPTEGRPVDMADWPDWDEGDEEYDDEELDEFLPFDRRAMEGVMSQLGMGFSDPQLQEAQSLMYQAWEEPNPARRLILAHEALEQSPDCADAYVLLAEEEADTVGRALEYYQKGVEAGERALGKEFFKENAGHFWGIMETRPYMRARQGVANLLWELDRTDEAAAHYRAMLDLNPHDNQGVRYSLLNLLLSAERDAEADALIAEYEEDGMAEWLYGRALLTFRLEGDGAAAKSALKEALEQNPHVPAYLTGRKRIPGRLPEFMGWGDENEAIIYASAYLPVWRRTPGAVEWLKANVKQKGRGSGKGKKKRKS